MFSLSTQHSPTKEQARAAATLASGISRGDDAQTLLGVTGSGKTFTMAQVIEMTQRPALVISHNKTLAWQLYQEFTSFFPKNAVHYFVSYYDYYQPEAYLPTTDTYIEKDARINEIIDKLRHAATQAVLSRKDALVVASVSCIYNIGDPIEYERASLTLAKNDRIARQELLRTLVRRYYERNDAVHLPGTFSARGDVIDITLPTGDGSITLHLFGDTIERIEKDGAETPQVTLFPAKHFVTPEDKLEKALERIEEEMKERVTTLKKEKKVLEAARLEQRTHYDIEMLKEAGYISGIENYSRHLSLRPAGEPPFTLIDYFHRAHGENFVTFVDESHMTIPQIRGMFAGDRARKETLVEHGFRLPSALDNRPLTFPEWEERTPQKIFVSATPGVYEYEHSGKRIIEQLLRPTHILDPVIEIRDSQNQVDDLIEEIHKRVAKKERVLVTVITKRLAEELSEHLEEEQIRSIWLHSEVHTLKRPEILDDLRRGTVDVLVGVNLLREGLDLPEVSLVAILDADKEGFLRNETTLIQTMGRAARHPKGTVIMYARTTTESMRRAIEETERRRDYQAAYNKKHGLTPHPIVKEVAPKKQESSPDEEWMHHMSKKKLEKELARAVEEWDFERAIRIRDYLKKRKNG